MAYGIQGIPTQYDTLTSVQIPIANVFSETDSVNRNPLFTRLRQAPLRSWTFKTSTTGYLPRTTTMNDSGGIDNAVTSMVVTDSTIFQPGDTIEIESEMMLVTAVTVSTHTLTITRAYAGTSAASHADALTIYKVGNTRTGSEINQSGIAATPVILDQYAQTFQHPYAMGGAAQAHTELALPPGVASALGYERAQAMQRFADDVETALIYGRGVSISGATSRPQMVGLRSLITTNNVTSPTNASAYKPSDFIRDVLAPCTVGGGQPDVVFVSNGFQTGLATWGMPLTRLDAGATKYGVNIDMFEAPFLNGITFVLHPLLRSTASLHTAIALTSNEVNLMVVRAVFDKPRGSQGDADQGDIIGEYSLRVDNEKKHSFVTGITGFAAQT